MVHKSQELKSLQTKLQKENSICSDMKMQLSDLQRDYSRKKMEVKKIKSKIAKIEKSNNIRVSEHAILRYFERVLGFDIKEIENKILSDEIKKMVNTVGGSGQFPNDGFRVAMKEFTVTTILK